MIRIFVPALAPGEVAIAGDEHHYLSRVRRARVGDAIELVTGGSRAAATIARMTAGETIARVEVIAERPPGPVVRVLVPLIKGDRMDLCIEKLVEVGASNLIVWAAERSVVKLDPPKRDARVAHYAAVAAAAARQSGAPAPAVGYAPSLDAALAGVPARGVRLVLDPRAERAATPAAGDVTIASGPEGGLAPGELERLASEGFAPFGLGPRVLRAETAPVIAVALVRAASDT